jgi:hypothetical protein
MRLSEARRLAELGVDPVSADVIVEASKNYDHPLPVLKTGLTAIKGELVDYREFDPPDEPLMGMAGFATYDEIINALSLGRKQVLNVAKTSFTVVANLMYDYWTAAGLPGPGAFGTALTGRSVTDASAGAIPYSNPSGGRQMHLVSWGAMSTVSVGTILLYDRVYEYPFNGTVTSGSFTVPSLVPRDVNGATAGEGLMMLAQNYSATANASVTLTPTYTNAAGAGSRTNAMTIIASGTSGRQLVNPNAGQFWTPLAAGDTGVRQVDSYTLSGTATSTQMCLTLFRPLAFIPAFAQLVWIERDMVLQIASLPRIYDDSALSMLLLSNTTGSGLLSSLTLAEN